MKKVGVILVNYNGEVYIRDCIDSLLAQTYKNLEILFWDNHSKDASVETVRKMYPKIHLIESPHNYGFAKANNLAVKRLLQMGVEYVLLLNVDTVADSCLIEYLLEKADNRTLTTAQIYMDRKGRKIWYAGGELQFNTGKSKHLQLKTKKEEKVSFISGCCMMIHKDIIRKCGLFDEDYYLYYEDTDLCMRWYLHHIKMYYIPKAKLWHKVGGSSGGIRNPLKEYYMVRNRLYFVGKYWRVIRENIFMIVYSFLIDELTCLTEYDRKMKIANILGIIDYLRKKKGMSKHKL